MREYAMKIDVMRLDNTENMKVSSTRLIQKYIYLGSMLTADRKIVIKIKPKIGMAMEVFNEKNNLFCIHMDLGITKLLVKRQAWYVLLRGCKSWTLRKR